PLKGAPASFSGDELQLVAARQAPHDQRLDQTVLADARRELLELLRVEVLPWLALLRDDLLERADEDALVAVRLRCRCRGEQGVEPAPQRAPLRVGGAHRARISRARDRYPCAPLDCTS